MDSGPFGCRQAAWCWIRNGSDQVLKQFVWGPPGQTYVDELLQVSVNQDPADTSGGARTPASGTST